MDTVDILIHIHSDLSPETRAEVEEGVMGCAGVLAANFDRQHPHALTVLYNPDKVQDKQILETVQQCDPTATMVGM